MEKWKCLRNVFYDFLKEKFTSLLLRWTKFENQHFKAQHKSKKLAPKL